MEHSTRPLIHTREREARRPDLPIRGSRYWTHAGVKSDIWFVVELAVETLNDGIEVHTVFTADFWEARRVYQVESVVWANLFAYFRAPLDIQIGYNFESVDEVHQIGNDRDKLCFKFKSGLMMMTTGGAVVTGQPLQLGRKVFSR